MKRAGWECWLRRLSRPSLNLSPSPSLPMLPEWARGNCHLDHKGRMIFVGGDLDCRYEDYDLEERQMPRLRGRLPYNTDGIVSMARNEHVRFLPGAFGDLGGEILALVGGDYDNPLAGTAQRSLSFADADDDALNFNTGRVLGDRA